MEEAKKCGQKEHEEMELKRLCVFVFVFEE